MDLVERKKSRRDGSIRLVWRNDAGQLFESACLPFEKSDDLEDGETPGRRYFSVCLSSQSGCRLGCAFCATSSYQYSGTLDLTTDDLVSQARASIEVARASYGELELNEIAFMGMGEPLANRVNVFAALEELTRAGLHVSLATVGLVDGLEELIRYRFTAFPKLKLSVHGLKNRAALVPIEHKHPIARTAELAQQYAARTPNKLMLNWILLAGINDGLDEAIALGQCFNPALCKVHISEYGGKAFTETPFDQKVRFICAVQAASREKYGQAIEVCLFGLLGKDIEAGCGQLVGQYHL